MEIANKRKETRRAFQKKILFITILAFATFFIYIGGVLHKKGTLSYLNQIAHLNFTTAKNYFLSWQAEPELMKIDLKHNDFQRINYKRQLAVKQGHLSVTDEDYVPAKITYGGKTVKVKLRLKGDHIDHLLGEKWSFRIKVKGEETIEGMKRMSIHTPAARNYIYEWFFHQILKSQDVLSLRYKFIEVIVNGKNLGIYALEEHFEKRLIEYNRRREGLIIRFNENLMWKDGNQSGFGSYLASDIDAFQTSRFMNNKAGMLRFKKAMSLLESFRREELKTSEVFDVEKLAMFFAITELCGTEHGAKWHNTRFYYNPITSRFEPIGFDGNSGLKPRYLCANKYGCFLGKKDAPKDNYYITLFKDEVFFKAYIKALEKVSNKKFLDEFFNKKQSEINENLQVLHKEFPKQTFNKNIFYQNQKTIQKSLYPVKAIQAYFAKSNEKEIQIEIANIQNLPVEIESIIYTNREVKLQEPILLSAYINKQPLNYRNISFKLKENDIWNDSLINRTVVKCKILGTSKSLTIPIFAWKHKESKLLQNDLMREKGNIDKFDFLTVNKEKKEINILSGKWELKENLIVPKEYLLKATAGTEINLENKAKIVSHSAINFCGTKQNPIIIKSQEKTGEGLIVLQVKSKSVLKNVIFDNLSNPKQNAWSVPSAVTFFEAPVKIENCSFKNNRSEDGLNLFRSKFEMNNCYFENTKSDAFDSDFSDGIIRNTEFYNSGNDAVDISGCNILLENIKIDKAGDKGLSAGEKSIMKIKNAVIVNVEIAVASKDMSIVYADSLNIIQSSLAFTVFRKKPEFGFGKINAKNVSMKNIKTKYLIETNSEVTINEKNIEATHDDVKAILYGKEYGKATEK